MKKKCSTTTLSQKVYEGDFYSHVFANPVSYIYVISRAIIGQLSYYGS